MLLKPHLRLARITDLTAAQLARLGVRGLLLDIDNTLSTHNGQTLTDGLSAWLAQMRAQGVGLMLLSNAPARRVEPFARKIDLPYQSRSAKPLPFGYLRAARRLKLPRKQVAIVGDQLFTDMLGGHLAGVKTILLTPIAPETGWSFRLRRRLERPFLRHYPMEEERG